MSTGNNIGSGKAAKAGAGYIIGNYLLKGITFLSAPLFTRILTTADFGLYSTYSAYMSIFYIIIGLALQSSINTAKYKYKEDLDSFVSSIVLLMLLSTGIWLLVANSFFGVYEEWFGFDRVILNCLIFHCLGYALIQVFNVYVSLNYSVRDFFKMSAFNAVLNLVLSVALILTVFSSERYIGRIIGSFVPMGLIGLYIVLYFFKKARPHYNGGYWRYSLRYSLPIIPHGIAQVILGSFDRIMIKNMENADAAGIYSFSYTVSSLFSVASSSLDKVWRPWGYEKMHEGDYEAIKKQATKYTFGMAMFAAMIMMVSPEIIKVLGDEAYWDSTACVIPVIIGTYFIFLYTLPSLVEYVHEKTVYIAVGSIGAAVMNIILNYIFIPIFGYVAAAYTTMITYALSFGLHYIIAAKVHGSCIFDTTKLILISLLLCFIGACTLILESQWYIRWLLEAIICFVTFYWADNNFGIRDIIKRKLNKQ
jgi:O-antigen/teichoic acid export membrane protein